MILITSQCAAHFKHPVSALLYVGIAVGFSFYLQDTIKLCNGWKDLGTNVEREVCRESKKPEELKAQLEGLVNGWMCTPDCRCYAGEEEANVKEWRSYDLNT